MHRPPDIETIADFHQYYRGSFIGWKNKEEGHEFVPAYVVACDHNNVTLNVDSKKTMVVPFQDVLNNCQFGNPQYGACEYEDTAVYVSRRAMRNAGRGHRNQALNVHIFHPASLTDQRSGTILMSWPYIRRLFNPEHRTFGEAYYRLTEGERLACSISRHLTASLEAGLKYPVLFYKTELVGHMVLPSELALDTADSPRNLLAALLPGVTIS